MKKLLAILMAAMMLFTLAACSEEAPPADDNQGSTTPPAGDNTADDTAAGGKISVVTREDGSGTRGAFVEITGVMSDDMDNTTVEAIVQDGTGKVMVAVAQSEAAIGYISLGSLDETVKAVKIDGVEATSANILSGDYKVARPFNIATLGTPEGVAADLIGFIMSADGQAIVEAEGYIPLESQDYSSTMPAGDLIIGGSTSVAPLMEKLVEAYNVINPDASITIEGSGSSAGMKGAIDGTYDMGMASRELKDSETAELETHMAIAQDGIAVVVNSANSVSDLSLEQVRGIYTGEITDWSEVK